MKVGFQTLPEFSNAVYAIISYSDMCESVGDIRNEEDHV